MIRITSRGIPELKAYLEEIKRGAKSIASRAVAEYLLGWDGGRESGNVTHGLAHYPPYNQVSRTQAYGQPFSSDRQRRWFFAALGRGEINPGFPRRTGEMQRGWDLKQNGTRWSIANSSEAAKWTMGDDTQARQPGLVGWRRVSDVVRSNLKGAFKHATAVVKKYLASKRKRVV